MPAALAASTSLTAPPRSIVRLRASPLPGPAPAAKTTASAPAMTGPSSMSDSRSASTASAPAALTSSKWSRLRTRPRTFPPRAESRRSRRSATLPCPPATTTSMSGRNASPLDPVGRGPLRARPALLLDPVDLDVHALVEERDVARDRGDRGQRLRVAPGHRLLVARRPVTAGHALVRAPGLNPLRGLELVKAHVLRRDVPARRKPGLVQHLGPL